MNAGFLLKNDYIHLNGNLPVVGRKSCVFICLAAVLRQKVPYIAKAQVPDPRNR